MFGVLKINVMIIKPSLVFKGFSLKAESLQFLIFKPENAFLDINMSLIPGYSSIFKRFCYLFGFEDKRSKRTIVSTSPRSFSSKVKMHLNQKLECLLGG